jgi:protein involved in polysaccharide export with SLBB domain
MEKYIDIPGREYFNTYNNNSYSELILKDGDVVTLKPINTGLKNVVKIEGAINYPDEYEVREGEKLNKVLERAGGIASTAYMPRAFVYRGTNPIETKTIKIDLRDYENDPNQNIEILAGDRINILSNKDFEQDYFIEVIGNVRTPKKIKYSKNIRLKDALLMSGGLSLDAENGHIEISNIVDSVDKYNIKSKGSNIKIVSINSNLEIDETSENIILKPLDRVYVRRKIEFLKLEKVQVLGEVNYAGEYALIERGERLSSILKRTGGLKKTAYPQGAKLIRQNIGQVVIDLPSVLGNNTKSGQTKSKQFDFALEDGDILIVPTLNDIVSVKGEVQSEINIKYDKNFNNVEYYISTAGGYGDDPWKKRINIKYQNGKIKSTKHILFFNKYPKVKEGCTVFVPKKPKRENKTKFSEIFSYSLSAITSLATLLVLSKSLSK